MATKQSPKIVRGFNPDRRRDTSIQIDIPSHVRVLEVHKNTIYLWFQPAAELIESTLSFDFERWYQLSYKRDGIYFVDHLQQSGNYLGATWKEAASELGRRFNR
jgi:hypothetical protein